MLYVAKLKWILYSRYYKTLSNKRPSWIEDALKGQKMLEKKLVLGDAPKSLKNKFKAVL